MYVQYKRVQSYDSMKMYGSLYMLFDQHCLCGSVGFNDQVTCAIFMLLYLIIFMDVFQGISISS